MILVLIVLLPILYAGWIEWLENRPRGASDYHVRRIKEFCKELGQKPIRDSAIFS